MKDSTTSKPRRSDYARAYYLKHQERLKAKANERRMADREGDRARKRAARRSDPETHRARDAAYYTANRERLIERARAYADANPEKVKGWKRQYQSNNPSAVLLSRQAYRAANRELLNLKNREYRRAHPEIVARHNHARRIRKLAGKSSGDAAAYRSFVAFVRTAPRLRCYWCGGVTPKARRVIDHIIPLAKQGRDDVHNLCCSCRSCNAKKNSKRPEVFSGQYVIEFVAGPA
jgi:hypothetical protein